MTGAAINGVDVLAILTYPPPWASSDPSGLSSRNYPPRDPADYARYAANVAARYGRGGSFWQAHPDLTPRPLRAVELWNEPWGKWAWRPDPDPASYARLSHGAAVAVRKQDPAIQIVLPADVDQFRTDGVVSPWFHSVLDADPGLMGLVDALSVHPYPEPLDKSPLEDSGWAYSRVRATRALEQARGFDLPVWITEIGWSTASPSVGGVSEAQQARFLH